MDPQICSKILCFHDFLPFSKKNGFLAARLVARNFTRVVGYANRPLSPLHDIAVGRHRVRTTSLWAGYSRSWVTPRMHSIWISFLFGFSFDGTSRLRKNRWHNLYRGQFAMIGPLTAPPTGCKSTTFVLLYTARRKNVKWYACNWMTSLDLLTLEMGLDS